jgi:hypothetical protein
MAKGAGNDTSVRPSAEGLAASAKAAAKSGPPPVHLWDPPHCGDLDMEIRRDGTWFYEGTPIGRPALVRLFASILRRDGDNYVLVTPVEKVGIRVEDAPFVAVDVERDGDALVFETNVGDRVTAGPDHAIRVERREDGPAPYLHVRRGLEALIDRKSFYRLADMGEAAEHEGRAWFGVRSAGTFFPMIPADELPD